jgi:thiol:disulfide interchange protein DsbD
MKVSLDQTSWWQVKDDSNALSTFLENTSMSFLLLAFFILGVGLAFTPCMLPMLPILSSIIFGTTEHHLLSRRKTVTLAISYILGMAFAFSLAGMATAWFGAGFAAILQNQWVLLSFTIFMLFLAGSLFGFYELKISSSWQSMINRWMGKHQGGSFAGVFILGGLSSLIASPCITAPLAGVLTFIAKSGEVQQGGMILFVMACGMGLPLLLFAIGASRIVPRVGPWMIRVQRFFGIALVILAAWIVSPVINSWIMPSQKSPDGTKIIAQLPYRVVTNEKDLKQLLDGAKNEQKPALITFYADWCVSCKELELRTLADQRVKERLTRYERIEVDLSILGEDQKDLLRNYGLFGPPAIIILDDRGIEKKSARSVGFISAERLRELL